MSFLSRKPMLSKIRKKGSKSPLGRAFTPPAPARPPPVGQRRQSALRRLVTLGGTNANSPGAIDAGRHHGVGSIGEFVGQGVAINADTRLAQDASGSSRAAAAGVSTSSSPPPPAPYPA